MRQLAYPDIQVLWMPGAHAALAKTMLSSRPPDVVLISGPPFSQFLLAPLSRTRAKVVLDYRDEWALIRSGYEMTRSRIEKLIGDPLEAALLRLASMVTTATEEFRQNLLDRFRFLDPARVVAIPNGYDPEDFPADMPLPPKDEFVISNVGTVFRLTSPKGFLEAVKKLRASRPDLTKPLRVKFVGRIVDLEQAAFEGAGVEQFGYLDHDEAVRMLGASHLVLVVLDDVDGNERIYPAKIFEAMYVKRPTLTLAPPGALSRLVEKHHVGDLLRPRDVDGICALLERKLLDFRDGRPETTMSPVDIERFDRRHTAGQFADVMKRCE